MATFLQNTGTAEGLSQKFWSWVVFCPGGQITASYLVPHYRILSAHAHMLNMRAEAARVRPVQTTVDHHTMEKEDVVWSCTSC